MEIQGLIVVQLIGGGDKLAALKALTAWAAIPAGNTCMTQDLWRQACGTVFGLPSETDDPPAFGQQYWRAVFNRLSAELGMLCWAVGRWLPRSLRRLIPSHVAGWHTLRAVAHSQPVPVLQQRNE